jgi:general secretion pathway protein K
MRFRPLIVKSRKVPVLQDNRPARGDDGFALIAALAGVVAFGLISFEVLSNVHGNVMEAGAEIERAKLSAAADAGVMTAVAGLVTDDLSQRWPIDGSTRQIQFNGYSLTVSVQDERGKIPINLLSPDQTNELFQDAGLTGDQLTLVSNSFVDWIDDDDDKSGNGGGSEAADYLPQGIHPRNGAFRTVDELLLIKGMSREIYARIAPALTVFFGESGGFSEQNSQPLALAVMEGGGMSSPEVLQRQKELAGERPAIDIDQTAVSLVGRTLTVHVHVADGGNGSYDRAVLVEVTGKPANPYWVRWIPN